MVAGIGCRAGVSGEQVEAAIDAAIAALCAGWPAEAMTAGAQTPAGSEAAASNGGGCASGLPGNAITDAGERGRAIITAIATPVAKVNEAGIHAAAAARGVPLLAISQEALEAANPHTVTRSDRSMAAMNVHSVAEAAALAGTEALANSEYQPKPAPDAGSTAIGPTPRATPRLLQPRIVVGPVTCALADTTT